MSTVISSYWDDGCLYIGPFLDAELYEDIEQEEQGVQNLNLNIDSVDLYRSTPDGTAGEHIGLDMVDDMHYESEEERRSYEHVYFTGTVSMELTHFVNMTRKGQDLVMDSIKCSVPTADLPYLRQMCSENKLHIMLECKLRGVPSCYLTNKYPNDVLMTSEFLSERGRRFRRRYFVKSFHPACLLQSELTLRRYMVLRFIKDACHRSRSKFKSAGPGEKEPLRDVHWLVTEYIQEYKQQNPSDSRPTLHRAEIYHHFAEHARWLEKAMAHQRDKWVDTESWDVWISLVPKLQRKAAKLGRSWGTPTDYLQKTYKNGRPSSPARHKKEEDKPTVDEFLAGLRLGPPVNQLDLRATEDMDENPGSSPVKYDIPAHLHPLLKSGPFAQWKSPMPNPTLQLYCCTVTPSCTFKIDFGNLPDQDCDIDKIPLFFQYVGEEDKSFILRKNWKILDKRLMRIWESILQKHMDEHWMDLGIFTDHTRRRLIRATERS